MRKTLILLLFFYSISRAEPSYRIVSEVNGRLVITVSTPDPVIRSVEKNSELYSSIRAADWSVGPDGLPSLSILLHLAAKVATFKILSLSDNILVPALPPFRESDQPLGPDSTISTPLASAAISKNEIADLQYLGLYQESHLWSLRVAPFRFTDGNLSYARTLVLEISTAAATATVPISPEERSRLQQLGVAAIAPQKVIPPVIPRLDKVPGAAGSRIKIILDEDGIYRISGNDLAAIGVNPTDIEIKKLRLTCRHSDVPVYVSGWQDGRFQKEDYFEFWGEALRQTMQQGAPELYQDPFTSTNVYWLSWDGPAGIWLAEEQAGLTSEPADDMQKPFSFYETVHVEADNYFDRLNDIQNPDSLRDLWFFDSGIGAGSKKQYSFETPWPDAKSPLGVQVKAWLSGRSTLSTEHQVSLFLNDQQVLSGSGWRQSLIHLQTTTDQMPSVAILQTDNNNLSIINEVDLKNIDFVMLNWFEVTYPRLYRAYQGFLKFSIPPDYDLGRFMFQVDGFATGEVDVYKLGVSKLVGSRKENKISSDGLRSFTCTFQDQVFSRETRYVAVEQEAKKKPLAMEWIQDPWQLEESVAVDYLVVTAKRFLHSAALKKLTDHRQAQGRRVMVVSVDDIYDAFGEGQYSSQVLKRGLTWFYEHSRSPKLKYILLVGDGCYQRNRAKSDSLDLVPAHFRQTVRYGATASDYWYALLSGKDEIPDVHLGRLPVRKEEELQVLVNKIIGQETEPFKSDWRNRLLFIGGNGPEFRDRGSALAHNAPLAWDSRMLFTIREPSVFDPFFGGTADLLDYVDEGCAVINFHGHGGGAIWSDNGLLRLEDVSRMSNRNRYPLILSMTCFTGAFDATTNQSLADAMSMAPNLGTMAFFGASGLGWLTNDDLLQTEIMGYLYEHPEQTIGEIIDAGKIRYLVRYSSDIAVAEVNQYNLLGDPASRFLAPSLNVALSVSNALPQKGDTLSVSCLLPFSRGLARWQLVDSSLIPLESKSQAITGVQIGTQFIVPKTLTTGSAYIRLYAGEDLGPIAAHGAAIFSVSGSIIDSVRLVLKNSDTLYVHARIKSLIPLTFVVCRVFDVTLTMALKSNDWYVSSAFPLSELMNVLQYQIIAQDENGRTIKSKIYQESIKNSANLYIERSGVHWGGTDTPLLLAAITNNGAGASDLVYLRLDEADPSTNSWRPIARDSTTCPAYSTSQSALAYAPAPGVHFLRLLLDSDQDDKNGFITQSIIQLETQAFAYQPENGVAGTDTLHYDDFFSISMPGGTYSSPGVLHIQKNSQPLLFEQVDLKFPDTARSYRISYSKEEQPAKAVTIAMRIDTVGTPSFYIFSATTKKWRRIPSRVVNRQVTATVSEWGEYAVLYGVDSQPPVVEIHLDGRPFQPGVLTAANPHISILLQDQNGIDISSGSLRVLLDGKTPESPALPDSVTNANQLLLQGQVSLSVGDHHLVVAAQDCYGNSIEPIDLLLRVAADFQLLVLGNYPNPFASTTVFAYQLTQPAEKLTVKIYSASGRLIRTIDPRLESEDPLPLGADYHELTWDGRDEQGYEAANGIYFFRFIAVRSGETKETTGKIARIR